MRCFLLFLMAFSNYVMADVPKELTVRVGTSLIRGWKDERGAIYESLGEWEERYFDPKTSSDRAEKGLSLPPEGFVYLRKDAEERGFVLHAWSAKGRSQRILDAAERALTQSLRADRIKSRGEDPGGYMYSERATIEYASREIPMARKEKKYPPKARIAKTAPVPLPVSPPAAIRKSEPSSRPVEASAGPLSRTFFVRAHGLRWLLWLTLLILLIAVGASVAAHASTRPTR